MRKIVFEVCAESVQACVAAREGGADRVELCSALDEGGLTPSHGLILEAVERSGLPVHVMLRPRGGNFVYTEEEFAVMQRDLQHLQRLGARGVVLGILQPDSTVDVERTSRLVQTAGQLEVTFHRAFDEVPELSRGLEDVIHCNCARLLTSGGEEDALAGSQRLSQLVQQAAGRIAIAVGGGVRISNAATLMRQTGASHFHGSLRSAAAGKTYVDPSDVQAMVEALAR